MRKCFLFFIALCFFAPVSYSQKKSEWFNKLRTEKVASEKSVEWKNFGPGMSGYCEEFWCHPTDTNVMFMGPDMHVSFGTWDNGTSWQTIKDSDGSGQEMKRVLDIEFSLQNADYGMAIDWNGWAYETNNRGRSWAKINELGRSYKDIVSDPETFSKGWYSEQRGTRLSELAVDPTNDNIWYAGAGDFWNVKANHKSAAKPYGIPFMYADYGYILKSTDKGKTWKKITNGLSKNTDVAKIIVNPNHTDSLIMATNVGMVISGDGGLSWKQSAAGLPNNLPRDLTSFYNKTNREFVLFAIEQSVYEATGKTVTTKGGIYKSTDGGQSWNDITGNLSVDLTAISYPAEIERFQGTMANWFGISKNDAKAKFTQLPKATLPVFNRIVVNPLNKNELYITHNKKHDFTFGPGDVWRSLDGGKTWIVCAREGAYWKGGKDADYWKSRKNPIGSNVEFSHMQHYMDEGQERSGNRMMAINAAGEIYIGIDQQTLKSTDKGNTWKQVDDYETSPGSNHWIGRGGSNLPGRFMLLETGIKDRRLLCSGEHGLWQTTSLDGWPNKQAVAVKQIEGQNNTDGAHSIATVAVNPKDPNMIYFLSWRQEHRGKLRRSIDGGKTWNDIATIFDANNGSWEAVATQYSLTIDPVNPNNMYFCSIYKPVSEVGNSAGPKLTLGAYGFYRSFDGGFTWQVSNNGFHKGASLNRIALDPKDPNIIYAALSGENGGLFVTTDKGSNWKSVQIPSVIKAVNNVFIDRNNHNIFISTGRSNGTYHEGGVWKSADNGKTWKQIFKAPFVWQAETSPVNPNLIVISVAGQNIKLADQFKNPGVYLSNNGGDTWKKINKGLGQPDKIVDVKPDPYNENVLWCASWGCGWFVAYLNGTTKGWAEQ